MLVTQPGFITKPAKINRFLKSAKVQTLKQKLEYSIEKTKDTCYQEYTREQERSIDDVESFLNNFECVEIAFLMHHWESEEDQVSRTVSGQLAYINARHSEHNMFEVSYLSVSLGAKRCKYADELGLKDKDILEYQEVWRKFGIDPTKAEYVDEEEETVVIPQG